ncbi:hypothetical protein IPM19_04430 [bacterium]|nr:MAG: hypothetical protein IPM19_04430 [bacterium]
MKPKLNLIVLGLACLALIATAGYAITEKSLVPRISGAASSPVNAPKGFAIGMMDEYCTSQERNSALVTPGGSVMATDDNTKNPDCAAIFFDPGEVGSIAIGSSIYNEDFRIGLATAERGSGCTSERTAVAWTPWVSSGGGSTKNVVPKDRKKTPDCLWLYYQTRPLPAGIVINDVRVGIKVGKGRVEYTPSARNSGGSSEYSQLINKPKRNAPELSLSPSRLYLQAKLTKQRQR